MQLSGDRFSSVAALIVASFLLAGTAEARGGRAKNADNNQLTIEREQDTPSAVVIALGSHAAFASPDRHLFPQTPDKQVDQMMLPGQDETFLNTQLTIAAKASQIAPVLLLVADEGSRALPFDRCAGHEPLCAGLRSGAVRVRVASHQGPWIRDYGPQIATDRDDDIVVLDTIYDDKRRADAIERRRAAINLRRQILAEQLWNRLREDTSIEELLGDTHQDTSADELLLLEQMADIYSDPSIARREVDDDAPQNIAQAAMPEMNFTLKELKFRFDGGNIIRLANKAGQNICVTTTDVVGQNGASPSDVKQTLRDELDCRKVLLLRPLPGASVIKHVDMFLLPARPGVVLLANYDLTDAKLRERLLEMEEGLRDLVIQAAIAMKENARILQAAGFVVTLVPSLPPAISDDGSIYFPTLLNGLLLVSEQRRRLAILPDYANQDGDIQAEARSIIAEALPAETQIEVVESTEPAKLQGAVHCLTMTIPLRAASLFREDTEASFSELLRDLEDDVARRAEKKRERLYGTWIFHENETTISLQFDAKSVEISGLIDETATFRYSISEPRRRAPGSKNEEWQLILRNESAAGSIGVRWTDEGSFILVYAGAEYAMRKKEGVANTEKSTQQMNLGIK